MRLFFSRYLKKNFERPVGRLVAVAGLFLAFVSAASGQRINDEIVRPGMDRIDPEEGALRLSAFRNQRLSGDYVFEFQLEHKPRRARTVRYDGTMWGSWNDRGAISRVKIYKLENTEGNAREVEVDLIVQNGAAPQAWVKRSGDTVFQLLEGAAIFEPILADVNYSAFDLQMPFVFWQDYEYEGPELVGSSRVAQTFMMYPPADYSDANPDLKSVRIALDDTYDALLKVESFGAEGRLLSRFKVESFKKVDDQYIVSRITLTDYPSKNRTSFHVREANVGMLLDDGIFKTPTVE